MRRLALILALTSICLGACIPYQKSVIEGQPFTHVVAAEAASDAKSSTLHIYIDGDGRPFITPQRVARDPSPAKPYVFALMRQDPHPHTMLGRPCYHGLVDSPGCNPLLWTNQRYSPAVVDSMVRAATALSGGRDVVLIGYSGGGTLAMLMAPRLSTVRGVITVAANLDVEAWAEHHGYTPLTDSDNPARNLQATAHIPQRHYVGAEDKRVPPELTLQLAERLPPNSVRVLPSLDHTCCWARAWPTLLAEALAAFEATTRAQNAGPRLGRAVRYP